MTFVSTIGQAQTQIENLKKLLQETGTLQTQIATGKKTQTFAGLGTQALASQQSRASLASLGVFDTNITAGLTRINIMTSAVTQAQKQSRIMVSAMEGQIQNGNFDMQTLHRIAENALSFIKNLLNEQDGSTYVFAGADTANKPLDDGGALDTYAQTNIGQWTSGAITTDQLIASYQDPAQMNDSIMGYSATLASGNARNVFIKADDNAEIDYTTLANDPAFRDIIATATMLVNITDPVNGLTQVSGTPGDPGQPPGATAAEQQQNFYKVFNDLIGTMNRATGTLDQITAKLGYAQVSLQEIQDAHTLDKNVLRNNIGDVEDVDINEVAVKLSTLQTQLQASYQVTASLAQFSLANFIS
jgi:flagellar hook-associated protein 3 FlgL